MAWSGVGERDIGGVVRVGARACSFGFALTRREMTAKSPDLLIATYALSHGVALREDDADFAAMRRAGVALVLAR
jgi:predicted nucleic acid-binding protein